MLIKTLYDGWIDNKNIIEYDIKSTNNGQDYKVVARTKKYEYIIIPLLSQYCCGEAIIEEIAEGIANNKPSYNAFKSNVDTRKWWIERESKCQI